MKPKCKKIPQIKNGDWVECEFASETQYHQVGDITETYIKFNDTTLVCYNDATLSIMYGDLEFRIVRKVAPTNVIVDFGNGIRGSIRSWNKGRTIYVYTPESIDKKTLKDKDILAMIRTNVLKGDTHNIVKEILKSQKKWLESIEYIIEEEELGDSNN